MRDCGQHVAQRSHGWSEAVLLWRDAAWSQVMLLYDYFLFNPLSNFENDSNDINRFKIPDSDPITN